MVVEEILRTSKSPCLQRTAFSSYASKYTKMGIALKILIIPTQITLLSMPMFLSARMTKAN